MRPGYGGSWFFQNYESDIAPFVPPPDPPDAPVCNFCDEPVTEPWCPCLSDVPPEDDTDIYDDLRESFMDLDEKS